MKLYNIAHSRTGDKGNISTISVIAYQAEDYLTICERITAERVREYFAPIGCTAVERYELPTLCAVNFVLHNTLGGGVTRSLMLDTHGKSLSSYMLEIEL